MPKSLARRIVKVFFISLNAGVTLLFLLACLSPYVNPSKWWFSGFTGLLFPYLVLVQLFFVILWLFARPRLALIPVISLLIGWKQISVVFAWHAGASFKKERSGDVLRLVDWNIHDFYGPGTVPAGGTLAHDLASTILKFQPDVVCMQEFHTDKGDDKLKLFSDSLPYHYFGSDFRRGVSYEAGTVILSRYPIVASGRVKYPTEESLVWADIVKAKDTIRIYTTHLQSFKFRKADYQDLEKIRGQEDKSFDASRSIYRKMKTAFNLRSIQANVARDEIAKSPYPSVICGDFNDVPNSYTYFRVRGDRQDAFLNKGFGIGRSYMSIAPTLRIDYIFPTRDFEVKQFDLVDENLSDHIMLVTDLVLKK